MGSDSARARGVVKVGSAAPASTSNRAEHPRGATKPTASVSGAALVLDDASANGYALLVPVFMARTPQCFGGTLRLYAREDGTVVAKIGAHRYVDPAGFHYRSERTWNLLRDASCSCSTFP